MDTEDEEVLRLQVILKAEEAGILCTEKRLPGLIKKARRTGAPFVPWEFDIVGNQIIARKKQAKTGKPKTVRTKTLFCLDCGRRRVKSLFEWNGHRYICKDCVEEKKYSSKHRDFSTPTSPEESHTRD